MFVLAIAMACDNGGGDAPDAPVADAAPPDGPAPAGPTVTGTSPADGATEVDPSAAIEVTFSDDMDPATLGPTTFVVQRDGGSIGGTVTYVPATRTATLRPNEGLALRGAYTATVTTGATDVDGVALAADVTWAFVVRDGQWRGVVRVDSDEAGSGYGARLAVADDRSVVAVWTQEVAPLRWGPVARRLVPGAGWGAVTGLESAAIGGTEPAVAAGPGGQFVAVWAYGSDVGGVRARRFVPGTGWTPPMTVDPSSTPGEFLDVASSGVGDAMVVYHRLRDGGHDMMASHLEAGSWTPPTLLGSYAAPMYERSAPFITGGAAGSYVALFPAQVESGPFLWTDRYDAGTGWGEPTPLPVEPGHSASASDIAADASGAAIALWTRSEISGIDWTTQASRFVPGEGWTSARLDVADAPYDAATPREIAVAPSGEAIALWSVCCGDGPDAHPPHLWARRFVPATGWEEPVRLSDIELSAGFSAEQSAVSLDPDGNAVVVFAQGPRDGAASLYATRYVAGVGWAAPVLLEDSDDDVAWLDVAIDAVGAATITWSEHRMTGAEPEGWSVWSTRFD